MDETKLNDRQERFCQNLVSGMSATQAYIGAGYSSNGAGQSADQLLKNPEIIARLESLRTAMQVRAEMSRTDLLKTLEGAYLAALEKGAFGPAVSALALYAKICGYTSPEVSTQNLVVNVIDKFPEALPETISYDS